MTTVEPTLVVPPAPARDGRNAALVALALAAAVLLTWPSANAPYNDDWSYAMTVRRLIATGHLVYNGWASASIIAQAYYGAAWVRAAGGLWHAMGWGDVPDFAVLRLSTVPLAAAAVGLIYLLARRAGLRTSPAVFAALLVGWSPLYLPVAATFMTDAPGLFFTVAALYALVRAAEAETTAAAVGWLAAGVVVGGVGGTGRQIVWVVPLVVGPYAAWVRRREPAFALATAVGWVAVLATAVLTVRWFNRQPLTIPEPSPVSDVGLALTKPAHYLGSVIALGLTVVWVILPALFPVARGVAGRRAVAAAVVLAVVAGLLLVRHHSAVRDARAHHETPSPDPGHPWPYAFAPWIGNTLDPHGVMGDSEIGSDRPIAMPAAVRLAFAVLVFAAAALLAVDAAMWAAGGRRTVGAAGRFLVRPPPGRFALPALTLFALAYLSLLLPRSARDMTYDRYVLPLMPCLAIPLLLRGQRQGTGRVPPAAWALLGVYAAYGVATTQEVTALARARVTAGEQLAAAGVPRAAVHGGFEFDAWTQLLVAGHMNDPRLHPRWAYRRRLGPTPAMRPTYALELIRPGPVVAPTALPPVGYWSLLPPFHRFVTTDRYTDPWWLDTTRAATRPTRPRMGLPDAALPLDYDAPDTPPPPGATLDR